MVQCIPVLYRFQPSSGRLESLAQLDRNLTPGAYYRAQEGVRRSLLRIMLDSDIKMLKLVVSELLDHFPEERHTRMVLGQLF